MAVLLPACTSQTDPPVCELLATANDIFLAFEQEKASREETAERLEALADVIRRDTGLFGLAVDEQTRRWLYELASGLEAIARAIRDGATGERLGRIIAQELFAPVVVLVAAYGCDEPSE